MKATAVFQRVLKRNRDIISYLHEALAHYKEVKRFADEEGDKEEEYMAHNQVMLVKKELRKMVFEQKTLKGMIQAISYVEHNPEEVESI
jgi:thiamine phosphate synthase YjbQ (UPF0047 family)